MISKGIKYICSEYWNIENYEKAVNDETQMWHCHHRIEISDDGLHTIYSKEELKKLGLYLHRSPNELIFLTKSEHMKLHGTVELSQKLSKPCTENRKQKLSIANKGAINRNRIFKWLDPQGEIHYMASGHAHRWHPDWKKIEED
ncbi:MAG: hypothetical protein KBT03_02640 [Bacteroidales bacterium]|nr:hypothetical protein [Candidatus Scybalousia scybalohippi]